MAYYWYENEPERLKFNGQRRDRIYHFLLGDPGMCNYTDKVWNHHKTVKGVRNIPCKIKAHCTSKINYDNKTYFINDSKPVR